MNLGLATMYKTIKLRFNKYTNSLNIYIYRIKYIHTLFYEN